MDDDDVWRAIDRYRQWFADTARSLTPDQWRTPSLCEGWTVRDVAAHTTLQLLSKPALLAMAVRHLGSTNHVIKHSAYTLSARYDDRELLDRLERLVGHRGMFPGMTCRDPLLDILAHSLDIARPLGIDFPHDPADLAEAANQFLSYNQRKAAVFAPGEWRGRRLVASDTGWATGTGEEMVAPMADHFLLLTGRSHAIAARR